MEILIATHGTLSEGLKSSLEIILGNKKNISTITAYINSDFDLKKEYLKWENTIINEKGFVFTDLAGGSVNQQIINMKKDNITVISGVNLPLLLDFILSYDNNNLDEIILNSKNEIKIMNNILEYKDDFDF